MQADFLIAKHDRCRNLDRVMHHSITEYKGRRPLAFDCTYTIPWVQTAALFDDKERMGNKVFQLRVV